MAAALVFGASIPEARPEIQEPLTAFLAQLGASIGAEVALRTAHGYEALAKDVEAGACDLAWLPPIALVKLAAGAAEPLVAVRRGDEEGFHAVLLVRSESKIRTIDGLRGTRAAWVDPWSAAGFVVPRIELTLLDVDPRTLFRAEAFHGSHAGAIAAVVDGAADVAGTFAQVDSEGNVSSGAWSKMPGANVRVLAVFGSVPPDAIAVRASLDAAKKDELRRAFVEAAAKVPMKNLARGAFDAREFRPVKSERYDGLRRALELATSRGLFA